MPSVVVLITVGDHEPVIPFSDVVGKTGAVAFTQRAFTGLNCGVTCSLTISVSVITESHPLTVCNVAVHVPAAVKLCPFQV